MTRYALCLSLLVLASNPSFGLNWGSLVWLGGRQAEAEKPEIVEVVRWRQPVCVLPAKGVKSCLSGLSNLQKEYERSNGNEFEEEQKKLNEFVNERGSKIYENVLQDNSDLRSMYQLFEQLRPSEEDLDSREDKDHSMVKRTMPLSEEIVRGISDRKAKYFTASSEKPNLIYVTKVLNAPVTATLVALNCMPDVGIPLCEDEEYLKNGKLVQNESKEEEEVDEGKLLEMFAKQKSVVDVIRKIMDKPGESRTMEEKSVDVVSSQTSNLNLDEDSKELQVTEIVSGNENNDSDNNSNRDKRHVKSAVLDKLKNFFNVPTNTESIVVNDPVYVVNNPMQHPWWGMLQKHYDAFKKPIFVYQKPFNHTSILEWLLPKMPAEKLDFFQHIFENIQKKKFPLQPTNEESESQISLEKSTNPLDTTTGDDPSEPVNETMNNK